MVKWRYPGIVHRKMTTRLLPHLSVPLPRTKVSEFIKSQRLGFLETSKRRTAFVELFVVPQDTAPLNKVDAEQ
jgi:hypothetical protein